jgi:hypothetical protein
MTGIPYRLDRARPGPADDRAVEAVREALSRLRFGAIALTVHDGRVVQMEITEKRRFDG